MYERNHALKWITIVFHRFIQQNIIKNSLLTYRLVFGYIVYGYVKVNLPITGVIKIILWKQIVIFTAKCLRNRNLR